MTRIVYIYSEQELTPRAGEVISAIKNENGFDDVKFVPVKGPTRATEKILVFGSRNPEGVWEGVEFIHTYSIAQIMAKANAATVLTAALRLYFGEKHEVPKGMVPRFATNHDYTPAHAGFDYSLPTVIDIETDGNLGVTHTPEEVNLISVGLYQVGRVPLVYVIPNEESVGTVPFIQAMKMMLAKELPKFEYAIYHNGKFDTRVLNRALGLKTPLKVSFDTMLAHHVLNHAAGEHGLKALAQRYLGAPDWEAGIKSHTKAGGHYELIPWNKLVEYNGWDVYWTYQLYELFAPQIEMDENNQTAFMLELGIAEFLLSVERNGIPFNPFQAGLLAGEQMNVMDDMRGRLRVITNDEKFNPNSPQQVKKYLNEVWNCGVTTTNEAAIDEVKVMAEERGLKTLKLFCTSLITFRKASKIISTYANGWMKHARQDELTQSRVHPTFHVHGTSTGRLSSTKPNAQNMPREKSIRKIVSLT